MIFLNGWGLLLGRLGITSKLEPRCEDRCENPGQQFAQLPVPFHLKSDVDNVSNAGIYLSAVLILEIWQGACAQTALEEVGGRIADNAEAQIGLIAPKKFDEQVHHFVSQQTTWKWPNSKRHHVFFL